VEDNVSSWIAPLLDGLLPSTRIAELIADYERYQDVPLSNLGLDSLSVMGLVINIEDRLGRQVDYETFDISALETLGKARRFLGIGDEH
jgi:acyl carrier protein